MHHPPTLGSHPNNLPVQLTSLIGRKQEVAHIQHLLCREDVRLLTLTGPGGIGKTRLGLQVAAELSDLFTDGVYFVNLAPLSDPHLVVPTIAQTLDLKETREHSLLDLLKTFLRDKQLLLLLDNFEHVVSAAVQVTDLLAACSRLEVVVTSRAALHVRGEQEFAVPTLAVPDSHHVPDLVALSQYEAVALFLSRAQAVKPEFQLTAANARAVVEICVRLDGLPLAIELAAARCKLLPPQALLARLGQRLAVLTGGAKDVPARQQTLRNTIEWSYQLLDAQEQQLFRRLSAFVGGCTLEAIEAVCDALNDNNGAVSALNGVALLIDKSLLHQTEQEGEEPHLVMLETIREYGLERLAAHKEEEATRGAHAAYYLRLSEEAEQNPFGTEQAVLWLDRLEREHDNLRAALRWSLERGEAGHSMELALRLGGALKYFWILHGHYSEGRAFLERALAGSQGVIVSVRAKALITAMWLALNGGDIDLVEMLCKESLALSRELGDTAGIADTLFGLGQAAMDRGDLEAACSLMEEAVSLAREMGDKWRIASGIHDLAWVQLERGEYVRARVMYEECLGFFRELGDKLGIAASLHQLALVLFLSWDDQARVGLLLEESLALAKEIGGENGIAFWSYLAGQVALRQGDAAQARTLLEESLVLFKERRDRRHTARSLSGLARVEAVQSNYVAAHTLYEESLALSKEVGDKNIASTLEGLAGVVAAQGDPTWAARLWGAAESLRLAMGIPIPPVYLADYERAVAAVRTQLGEKAFAAAWALGRSMTPEQAMVKQAPKMGSISGGSSSPPPLQMPPTSPAGLTIREMDVLRLLAQGLTSAQMAEQLVIGLVTVNSHVRSIYSKLGVTSRSAATRYAIEHELL